MRVAPHLAKELPVDRDQLTAAHKQVAHRAKGLMKELAAISLEMAQLVVTDDGDSAPPPSWFLLRHDQRQQGRDPFLWNVACDYIINGWLMEMGVGRMPAVGALHDPDLAGLMM